MTALKDSWESRQRGLEICPSQPKVGADLGTASEIWAPVADAPGYEVSNLGRVRSLDRYSTFPHQGRLTTRFLKGGILKPLKHTGGYLSVCFFIEGKMTRRFIHRVVLEAFAGTPPPKNQARHLSGKKTDNRLCNLAWGTAAENQADRERHGMGRIGKPRKTRNFTEKTIVRIRKHYAKTRNATRTAAHFKLPRTTVNDIVRGRTWKHVDA